MKLSFSKPARWALVALPCTVVLLVAFQYSLRVPALYSLYPVPLKFLYHWTDHKIRVHGQRLLHALSPGRSDPRAPAGDGYLLLAGEFRPVLENPIVRLQVPPDSTLHITWGSTVAHAAHRHATPVRLSVLLDHETGSRPLYSYALDDAAPTGWTDAQIDLSSFRGQDITLRFVAGQTADCLRFAVPYLSSPDPGRPNVILVVLDTLRASRIGAYGYRELPASPFLDQLATEGAQFLNATSNSAGTFSSHMSLLTGVYPSISGVSYRNWQHESRHRDPWAVPVLDPTLTTLPQVLANHGYYTLAFSSGYLLMEGVGFYRGFHRMIDSPPHSVASIAAMARQWLLAERKEPFFMYFHSYEPHSPYEDSRFVTAATDEDALSANEARYVGDIRSADDALREFVAALEELGLKRRTVLIVTSDHGEEFGDHFPVFSAGHGESLFDEQVRVPLLFVHPDIPPARFGKQVQLVDLRPTLLEFLGIEDEATGSGVSLTQRLRTGSEEKVGERLAFAEDTSYGPEWKMLRNSRYKYMFLPTPWRHQGVGWGGAKAYMRFAYTDRHQLFDLQQDPLEQNNLYDRKDPLSQRFYREMQRHLAANQEAARAFALRRGESSLTEEADRSLRSLGYIQ